MNLRRNSLISLIALALIATPMAASRAEDSSSSDANGGNGRIEFPLQGGAPLGLVNHNSFKNHAGSTLGAATVSQFGIQYHGGQILNNPNGVNVYLIWYGNWGTDTAKTILPSFISGLNKSPYFSINNTYADSTGLAATGKVNLAGQYSYPTTTLGTNLTDANILTLAKSSLGQSGIPAAVDPNALYFVLTAPGINETTGFLTKYCGWHSSETMDYLNTVPTPATPPATNMKYSFVGDPASNAACDAQTTASPNLNVGADAMTSIIAHELEETVTDPDGTSWWNSTTGYENGDQCAWKFGTTTSSTTTASLIGTVSAVVNNGATNSATVTAASNNGATVSATLTKIAANATGTVVTFTTTAASKFLFGDKVTLPTGLPTAFSSLNGTTQSVTAVSTSTRAPFTFAVTLNPANTNLNNQSANTSGTVSTVRAGSTITFTNSGTNAFAVGDKVSVNAASPYSVNAAAITARTATSFTVSQTVPAGAAALSGLNITATAARAATSATYTYTPSGAAFVAGDKVSLTAPNNAYSLSNVAITAVTATSFTVPLALAAGTAAATFNASANVSRSSTSLYNMTLGGLKFLVQQNWANRAPGGVCALS
jgi:hypothetical protein